MWAKWTSNDRILAGVSFEDRVNVSSNLTYIYNVDASMTRLVAMRWDGEDPVNPVPLVKKRILQPQFQANVIDFLEDDPDHVLMQMDVDEMNIVGVQKIDVRRRSKIFERVIRGREVIRSWKTDKDNIVRYGEGVSNKNRQLKVRSVADYRRTEDTSWFYLYDVDLNKEDIPFKFVAFTDDPNVIYILKPAENGNNSLYTYNVNTKQTEALIAGSDDYEIEFVKLDEDGKPEWYRYNAEKPGIGYLTDDGKRLDAIFKKNFPNKYVSINSKSRDNNKIVFKVSASNDPGTYYLLDINAGKIEMLNYIYQEVNVDTLSQMKPVSYEARDGLNIPGYLSLPNGNENKKLPTVIFPHWGPAIRDTLRFNYIAQFLTSQGYAVLQMNYRGSTGYGKAYEKLGDHQWGNKMLEDINDGTTWMIEQGYADPDRICIFGDTYGGYAALQSIVKDQSLYKCSIAHAPITDLETYRETRRNYTNFRAHMNYIESEEYDLHQASPANNVDKINIPVLLMHSEKDRRVRVRQSQGFESKMKAAGKEIEFVHWKEGNNFLSGQVQRVDFLRQTGLFLEKHLK
tara:strand:- start:312278 stop:313987 length:1710 start_codon:yes stop_codon:yes gene_type:complete